MVDDRGPRRPENGDYVPLTPDEQRGDKIYKMLRDQDVAKTAQIIGPGPFYCSFCGEKMQEGGHMMTKFYLCPNAGEFTWSPPSWVRVEVDGVSYVVADIETTPEDLKRERQYYEMCADAHTRSAIDRKTDERERSKATTELKDANDRRAGRAG